MLIGLFLRSLASNQNQFGGRDRVKKSNIFIEVDEETLSTGLIIRYFKIISDQCIYPITEMQTVRVEYTALLKSALWTVPATRPAADRHRCWCGTPVIGSQRTDNYTIPERNQRALEMIYSCLLQRVDVTCTMEPVAAY